MENIELTWISGIRQKYNLLHFLATTSILLVLWELLMLINFFDGILFRDPNKLGMDLFVIFVFPLIAAPVISGLAIFIGKLLSIRGIRWLVVVGLGVVIPLTALLLALLGHLIARKLYTGRLALLGAAPKPVIVGTLAHRKMEQLKAMLDKGLITRHDYELKKAEILSRM